MEHDSNSLFDRLSKLFARPDGGRNEYVVEPVQDNLPATIERAQAFFRSLVAGEFRHTEGETGSEPLTVVIPDPYQPEQGQPRQAAPFAPDYPPTRLVEVCVTRHPDKAAQPYQVVISHALTARAEHLAHALAQLLRTLSMDVQVVAQPIKSVDSGPFPPLVNPDTEWILPSKGLRRQYELQRMLVAPPPAVLVEGRQQEMWFRYYLLANETYATFTVPKIDHQDIADKLYIAESYCRNLYTNWRLSVDGAAIVADYNREGWGVDLWM